MSTQNKINVADVYSSYLDADGSLYLYDKEGKDIEGWPEGWPEHIVNVRDFLEARDIHYVNKPKRSLVELVGEIEHINADTTKPDPLAEAVKRMEQLTVRQLEEVFQAAPVEDPHNPIFIHTRVRRAGIEAIKQRLIRAARGDQS